MNERLTDNFDLIERYFDGKLGKKEKSEFEERLLAEPKLKTQYDFYAALVEGIKEARRQELKQYLHENTESIRNKKTFFFGLLPYVLTLFFILSAVYFVTENYIPQYTIPKVINKVDSLIRVPYKAVERRSEEQLRKEFAAKQNTQEQQQKNQSENPLALAEQGSVDGQLLEENPNYMNVVEDEWEFDTLLTPSYLANENPEDTSAETAQAVTVEFWKSPLNSRGYQFNGKKLVLYGIEPPYKIHLLTVQDDLYLHYEKKYYYLELDGKFHPYREMEQGLVKKIFQR
ncbi:MAG: hypothetical protein K1X81_08020 [Bacteroidia bacterium]|nr:hypothetical protein [Bacteroidia bacterium]